METWRMFQRAITPVLQEAVSTFPVTALTGPRQSGKTTLLKTLFPDYGYINLEAPDNLLRAKADPRGFLEVEGKLIIDEAQYFPELFSYLQVYVDEHKSTGKFILSGSQNFLLAEKISQSLAGRAAMLELLPLTYAEFITNPELKQVDIWEYLFNGSYPRPYHEHLDTEIWYQSYIRTYLERDVRSLLNVRDLSKFQLFLKLCAGRHGQLLNMTAIAQETGISQTQASHWISILEASYLVYRLQPYYRNFNKRLVKTPKLYFYDSAIVCMLLGIESPKHLSIHVSRGAIFEGFVLAEMIKTFKSLGKSAPIYFWRDHQGHELDGLIERGGELTVFDAKSGKTITSDMFDAIIKWKKLAEEKAVSSAIIYAGKDDFKQHGVSVLSWNHFAEKLIGSLK